MSRTKADDLYFPMMDRQNRLGGVTIRAEFAKAAMQGLCANQDISARLSPGLSRAGEIAARIAEQSVAQADALIEALNVGRE